MALTLPLGIRLAAGLLGTAIDRASTLPAELPSLAVTFAGQALRTSMRVRQELAELANRGDELLAPLTGRSQEHPAWATFDEDEDAADGPPSATTADRWAATDDVAVTLLDGTPVGDDEPDAANPAPGTHAPGPAAFVVGPGTAPEVLAATGPGAAGVSDGSRPPAAPGAGAVPALSPAATAAALPATAPRVANARRTTTSRPRGRGAIRSDHRLTIAELKERTQQMTVAEVQALLAQEEAGPNRAAYLTLLGNRLVTLQHEDR